MDPSNRTLSAYILKEDGKYDRAVVYAGEDVLKTVLFEGLEVKMDEVLAE